MATVQARDGIAGRKVSASAPLSGWLGPGARLMGRLAFGQKVGVLLGIAGVVLASLLGAYLWQMTRDLQTLRRERAGLEILKQARPVDVALAAWADTALARAEGEVAAREGQARQVLLHELERVLASPALPALLPDQAMAEQLVQLLKGFEWSALQRDTNLAKVRQIAQEWRQLEEAVYDRSGLKRDADPLSFALAEAALVHVRGLQEALALAGPTALDTLRTGKLSGPGRAVVMRALVEVERHERELRAGFERIVQLQPALAEPLALEAVKDLLPYLIRRFEADIVLLPRADEDLLASMERDLREAHTALQGIVSAYHVALATQLEQRARALQLAVSAQVAVALVAVLAVLYLALAFYADTHEGVRGADRALAQLAEGDLRHVTIRSERRDELGRIARNIAHAQDNLRDVLHGIADTAQELSDSSHAMAAVAAELQRMNEASVQRLQEQTGILQRVGEGLGEAVRKAQDAERFTLHNAQMARDSRQLVQSLTQVMGDIQHSSQRIAEITGVIDGLSFQTNILALNAAVEAARAGAAGRGFAVVAAEVRSLALRSAEAARQIRGQIEESVRLVEGGVWSVDAAGSVMKQLIGNAEAINGFVAEIAASARVQSEELTTAISTAQGLVSDSRDGLLLVERTHEASGRLELQAQTLLRGMQRFRL